MALPKLLNDAQRLLIQGETNANVSTPLPSRLFFSVSDGRQRARTVSSEGKDFHQAWLEGSQACQRTAERRQLDVSWLRIDWPTGVLRSSWGELKQRLHNTKRNYFRFGLALDSELKQAFLEHELNANAMLYTGADTPHGGINIHNFLVHARRRFGAALTLDFDAPDLDQQAVWLFTHEGLFVSDDPALADRPGSEAAWLNGPASLQHSWRQPELLNSGRRQLPDLQANEVLALIRSGADFLARQVKPDGQFIYGHFPNFGRQINTYNSLRHASTVYSMLEAWELTRDDALRAAIERALDYLDQQLIRRYPQPHGQPLAFNVDLNDEIKLGANAVSLLALVKYDELTGDQRYRPLMEQLALGICHLQQGEVDADGKATGAHPGKFVHVLNAADLSIKTAFRIVYYDGEAAFGLMRLYGLTRDERWLQTVEKAFDYFLVAEHWRHHDHWLSYCANELTLYRPEEKYFRFGVQNIADHLDFILKRETTFPTLLELCMAFAAMIERIQRQHPEMSHVLDGLDLTKFERALHHRAHYQLNGFFWPELALFHARPEDVVGSFFIRHHAFRVRIDDVEHYLSGYVAYWKRLQHKPAAALDTIRQPPHQARLSPHGRTAISQHAVVIWGGDVNLGRRQHYRTAELGRAAVLDIPALFQADLRIINLECVLATHGEQGVPKGEGGPYYYRARPEQARILIAAGVDLVACANNHAGDYGPEALLEQADWLDAAGIGHAGSGINLEAAFEPVFRQAGELCLALFSVDATQPRFAASRDSAGTAYLPLDEPERWNTTLAPRIAAAREQADIVLVAVHWGQNLATAPSRAETTIGHTLIEAGADAVLGTSAHLLQGIEIYRGRPILYDAGDLLFDAVRSSDKDGGVFALTLCADGVSQLRFIPVSVGFGHSTQRQGESAIAACKRYIELCHPLGTALELANDGTAWIDLKPVPRPLRKTSRPAATRDQAKLPQTPVLDPPQPPLNPAWFVDQVPDDARIEPIQLGPLTLLGIRLAPSVLTERQMLWVESYWRCDTRLDEDLRLDLRATPLQPCAMPPWGIGLDHDPCDWMMPTSRWHPGVIYRDYYGLRPPPLRDWINVELQLSVNIVSPSWHKPPLELPLTALLAIPGKGEAHPHPPPRIAAERITHGPFSFSSAELAPLTGGHWVFPPAEELYIDYFVTGTGLVEQPRTCMVCMFHETWIQGTGNMGHYQNIFSDTHASLQQRHESLQLHDRINCLIVQRPIEEMKHIPQLMVADSYEALKKLAARAREKMADNGTIYAVTGAVGKSSTCDLLAHCLDTQSNCIAMTNGHNSRTGVMLWTTSLGRFDPCFKAVSPGPNSCILEVAGSALWMKTGWAMQLARPHIAIITHIALTQYGQSSKTIEDVARFKSRIAESMPPGGKLVLYREMPLFEQVRQLSTAHGAQAWTYGESDDADSRLISCQFTLPTLDQQTFTPQMTVTADILGEQISYTIAAIGRPLALNSVAALTAAKLGGFSIQESAKALAGFTARKNTLEVSCNKNRLILNATHNLETPSILAAFDLLAASNFSPSGRRIVVMGRNDNLGPLAQDYHLGLKSLFLEYGFDQLFLHNPDGAWDKLLPLLPEEMIGGVSADAKGVVDAVLDYSRAGDTLLFIGVTVTRNSDFHEILPGFLERLSQDCSRSRG